MRKLTGASFGLAVVLGCLAGPAPCQDRIEAITRPSQDVTLSFVRPGRIGEVLVKEGDKVKKDQVLMRLDDKAELAQLEQLKAQAEDETRVKAGEAKLAQTRVDLKKTEWAQTVGAATKMEVDHAELEVTIAELSLVLAKFERSQDQRKYQEATIQHERMRLVSPIDGVVENLEVEAGESADATTKAARVVKIDPLWIDVPVPLAPARKLAKGKGNAVVEFGEDEAVKPIQARGNIIHIAAVADSASGTLTVRVELANAAHRQAGEHVYVSFPSAGKTAKASPPSEPVASASNSRKPDAHAGRPAPSGRKN